jgi:hypothetical protein
MNDRPAGIWRIQDVAVEIAYKQPSWFKIWVYTTVFGWEWCPNRYQDGNE